MRRTAPHMCKRFAWTSQPPRFHASGFCRRSARISPTLGLADRWLREMNGICSTWVLFIFFKKHLPWQGPLAGSLAFSAVWYFYIHICNVHTHSMQERISETNCGTPPLNLVGPLPQLTLKKALGYRTATAKQVSMLKAQDPVDTLHDPDQHWPTWWQWYWFTCKKDHGLGNFILQYTSWISTILIYYSCRRRKLMCQMSFPVQRLVISKILIAVQLKV